MNVKKILIAIILLLILINLGLLIKKQLGGNNDSPPESEKQTRTILPDLEILVPDSLFVGENYRFEIKDKSDFAYYRSSNKSWKVNGVEVSMNTNNEINHNFTESGKNKIEVCILDITHCKTVIFQVFPQKVEEPVIIETVVENNNEEDEGNSYSGYYASSNCGSPPKKVPDGFSFLEYDKSCNPVWVKNPITKTKITTSYISQPTKTKVVPIEENFKKQLRLKRVKDSDCLSSAEDYIRGPFGFEIKPKVRGELQNVKVVSKNIGTYSVSIKSEDGTVNKTLANQQLINDVTTINLEGFNIILEEGKIYEISVLSNHASISFKNLSTCSFTATQTTQLELIGSASLVFYDLKFAY